MLKANIAGVPHAYEITERRTGDEAKDHKAKDHKAKDHKAKDETAPQTLVFVHGWMLSQAYWQPLVDLLSTRNRCLTYDLRGFGESTSPDPLPSSREQAREIALPPGRSLPHQKSTQDLTATDGATRNSASANGQTSSTDGLAKNGIARPEAFEPEAFGPEAFGPETFKPETFKPEMTKTYKASTYSLAAYAQDLGALLDELGIEQAWLLGHSLGGSIALWAAYLLPERIKGVICINAGGGIYIPKEFDKFRSAGQQMVKYRPTWLQQLPLLPNVFARMMVHQPLALHWGAQRIRDFVRADHQAAVGTLLETTSAEEVHLLPQVVSQITQPAHFITATEDTVMLPRYVHHLASFHPHFSEARSLVEIAECGHMAMVEQPQAVADVVRAVLSNYQ